MPPVFAVEPSPEAPKASEVLAVLLAAAELRDAVPADWVLLKRLVKGPDEEELEEPLPEPVPVDAEEVEAVAVDVAASPELELPPPPLLAAVPPPLELPPPPSRLTETVMEDVSPELFMLTDKPCRRPASRGAFSETYRSAAVTPVRRMVFSTPPWAAVTVRTVARGPCGPPVSGCAALFFSHHRPKPPSANTNAARPQAIFRAGPRTSGAGSGPGGTGRGCLSGTGRPLCWGCMGSTATHRAKRSGNNYPIRIDKTFSCRVRLCNRGRESRRRGDLAVHGSQKLRVAPGLAQFVEQQFHAFHGREGA